jgi:nucleoid DNA-binding protein
MTTTLKFEELVLAFATENGLSERAALRAVRRLVSRIRTEVLTNGKTVRLAGLGVFYPRERFRVDGQRVVSVRFRPATTVKNVLESHA